MEALLEKVGEDEALKRYNKNRVEKYVLLEPPRIVDKCDSASFGQITRVCV